jgi:hypothetical protein
VTVLRIPPAASPITAVRSVILQELRANADPNPKPKKPGRPRLAKGEAKGSIVPVRFSPEERKRVELAAKASKQNASQWIRSTLASAIGG